eukprot:XP_001705147.1 Hypothetical protein GL50803_32578 [Giardia lamblia ATCC 50803]
MVVHTLLYSGNPSDIIQDPFQAHKYTLQKDKSCTLHSV